MRAEVISGPRGRRGQTAYPSADGARVAQLGGRSALPPGCDRAPADPRRAGLQPCAGRAERGLPVRAAGSGHSFSEIACTNGVMLRLEELDRVLAADPERGLVKVEAGVVLGGAQRAPGRARPRVREPRRHRPPDPRRLDLDRDPRHRLAVSQPLRPARVDRAGHSRRVAARDLGRIGPELFRAARVGLGALGVIYAVTVRCVPAYTLHRVDSPKPLAEVLERLDELNERNDHFEFYVFPHTETALCRESRRTDEPPRPALAGRRLRPGGGARELGRPALRPRRPAPPGPARPRLARIASRGVGRSTKVDRWHKVFASERRIRFTEMEYSIPREHAAEAVAPGARARRPSRARRRLPDRGPLRRRRRRLPEPLARARRLLRRRPPGPQARLGALLPRRRGDHGRLRGPAPLGQAPFPDAPRRSPPSTPAGTSSSPPAPGSTPRAGSATPTPTACSARSAPRPRPD